MCAVTCAKCCCQNNSKFVLNCRLSTEGEDSKESKMDYSQEVRTTLDIGILFLSTTDCNINNPLPGSQSCGGLDVQVWNGGSQGSLELWLS